MTKIHDKYLSKDVEWVDINSIFPNDYNPNYMPNDLYNSLKEDIRINGIEYPITIRKNNRIIVDGFHRWSSCKNLGWKEVPVTFRTLTDNEAKIRTINVNRERGFLLPDLTGKLLKDLTVSIPQDILQGLIHMPINDMNLLLDLSFDPSIVPVNNITSNIMSWSEVESNLSSIVTDLKKLKFNKILYVGKSGMIPARLLADRLSIKDIIPYTGSIPENCILVDDMYDTGKTFKSVMKKDKKTPYVVITAKKKLEYPDNLIFSYEDEDEEYLVYPWNKFDYRKGLDRAS